MGKNFKNNCNSCGKKDCNSCGKNTQEKEFISHLQKQGMAMYDNQDCNFLFLPDNPAKGCANPFRAAGLAQLLCDGTFDFIRKPRIRAQSELIRKLAHGRVSKTKDGAIQLTLKVYQDEGVNIGQALAEEAQLAKEAVQEWQLKR